MTRITLDASVTSPPEARRWVTSRLGDLPEDIRRTAALLVSELVTNAVLHASTAVTVSTLVDRDRVLVEVGDGSPDVPVPKSFGEDAATGRGLTVVGALADDWGVRIDDGGKVVWFEICAPDASGLASGREPRNGGAVRGLRAPQDPARHAGNLDDLVEMALTGVPVALLLRAQAAYEELFREFRFVVERDPGSSHAVPGRLLDLVDELGTRFSGFTAGAEAKWRDAVAAGDEVVDLHYVLPRAVGPACRHYDALLDEAHEFCRSAALLTLAPPADVVALRKWVLGEFGRQAAGGRAVAWSDSTWASRLVSQR